MRRLHELPPLPSVHRREVDQREIHPLRLVAVAVSAGSGPSGRAAGGKGEAVSDVDEVLREAWLEMRNGAGPEVKGYVRGLLFMARALGALSDERVELWKRRVATCPGHDDEGGRDWCAYCGKMPAAGQQEGEGGGG